MDNKWELLGKVKASTLKYKVLKILHQTNKTPNELVKEANISSSHISEVLKDLQKLKLIKCLTPNLRKGKIYSLTELGNKIFSMLSHSPS